MALQLRPVCIDARLVDINLASKKNGHPYPEGPPRVKLVFSRSKPLERSSLNGGEQAGFASAEIKTPPKMKARKRKGHTFMIFFPGMSASCHMNPAVNLWR